VEAVGEGRWRRGSALKIPSALNVLATQGGLQYSPPIR